mgnify:CR=1 FL=1
MKKNIKESAVAYCIIYTLTTILNSIIYLLKGITEDPSGNWHELDRALILLIGVVAIQLLRKLNFKNKFINLILSYVPTMGLILGYVFLRGLRTELAQSAYIDVFFNFTALYIIIAAIDLVIRKLKS